MEIEYKLRICVCVCVPFCLSDVSMGVCVSGRLWVCVWVLVW